MEQRMHQIGEVADAVGLSLRTIRYYEEAELVLPSGRSAGGFRLYTDNDIERLRLVKQLKPLDLTIEEMRDLLSVRDQLADQRLSRRARDGLIERLTMFAELTDDRCQRLRDQLAAGEALGKTLRHEIKVSSGKAQPRR